MNPKLETGYIDAWNHFMFLYRSHLQVARKFRLVGKRRMNFVLLEYAADARQTLLKSHLKQRTK